MTKLNFYYYMSKDDKVIECDFEGWQKLAKTHGKSQVVKQDTIELDCGTEVEVSTICLMIDHNYLCENPLIFETMTFSDNEDYNGMQFRASTLTEAKQKHAEMLEYCMYPNGKS